MDRIELVEKLREKANLSMEEARDILEKHNWDMLDACVELERSGKMNSGVKSSTEQSGTDGYEEVNPTVTGKSYDGKTSAKQERRGAVKDALRSLIRMGIDNKFIVSKSDGDVLIRVPVILPIVCVIAQFWVTLIVLFVGLVFGLKYTFEGKELGKDTINNTMEKASEAANGFVNSLSDKKETSDKEQ